MSELLLQQILSAIETEGQVAEIRHKTEMSAMGSLDLIAREPCKNCFVLQDEWDDELYKRQYYEDKYNALRVQYIKNKATGEWPELGEIEYD